MSSISNEILLLVLADQFIISLTTSYKIKTKFLHFASNLRVVVWSLKLLHMFVRTPRSSTCTEMISSLTASHFEAISESSVFKQKLNLSATGIPEKYIS